ncbi:HprK-related kinase A [Photobacterium sp. BZF1]|uniref:HprK-related kinase A n=1 Tax=Photobacterium sp. BZF1 TaxID=1904457 RepID=UPI001653C86B|nr:HprK-related kinase A [Photobacterium sp. BZF1]MBC7004723.1 HprK-related kinase A [Photobacterium sp. BZF1]
MIRKKVCISFGSFIFEIETNIKAVYDYLKYHYNDTILSNGNECLVDYRVSIKHGSFLRRFYKPQAVFTLDSKQPFKPLPLSQAHAMLEWGMNWVISTHAHQYLIIHAAALEKNGKGLIISAPSGSGKSTLCAYLVSQGWRLLSDELALIHTESSLMHGLSRPINLKNKSIDIMKDYFEIDSFSNVAEDTHKGTVCLVRPPSKSIKNSHIPVKPHTIVFVKHCADEKMYIETVNKSIALTEIINNSFNFGFLNQQGFTCAKKLVQSCESYYIEYSDLKLCELELAKVIDGEVICDEAS